MLLGKFSDELNGSFEGPQADRLLDWYEAHKRDLPWRQDRDPYRVLVSELMLQQTTVAAVVPLYLRWMETFPTLQSLAQASDEEVMGAWSGLGYYSRASRLHQAAQKIHEQAAYPADLKGWLSLPGFGPYTAAAVVSIALGQPHLALDTNAIRVFFRYFGLEQRADSAKILAALRQAVENELTGYDFGQLNQAVMELGATLCRVRAPGCSRCPLRQDCRAAAQGNPEGIPRARPKPPLKSTPARVYLLGLKADQTALVLGSSLGLLSKLYQPLIDFLAENRDTWPLDPLLQGLRAETKTKQPLARLSYSISGRRLQLEVFHIVSQKWVSRLHQAASTLAHPMVTVNRSSLEELSAPLSSLTRKILKVWQETPSAARLPVESSPGSEPVPRR